MTKWIVFIVAVLAWWGTIVGVVSFVDFMTCSSLGGDYSWTEGCFK